LFFDPIQDRRDQWIIELAVHDKVVRHVVDLEIACMSRMGLVDDLRYGFAVGSVHDRVISAVDDEHRSIDALPPFAQVQGLQLLIAGCGATVVAVG